LLRQRGGTAMTEEDRKDKSLIEVFIG